MPLPQGFSEWEHLQSVIMQVHNRIVRDEFNDADDDDISTPRASLKTACLLKDSDSILQTLIRYWLFYVDIRKASDLQLPIYAIPTDRYQQQVKFAPQITLYFKEDLEDVETGYSPIDAEISFRLQNERFDTVSQSELNTLATKIRSEFATGTGYYWRKGRVKINYRDPGKGYLLSLNAVSESEGRTVIGKVLDIQGDTIDPSLLTFRSLAVAPPTVPPTESILGKSRRLPRRMPVGNVRFIWAECHLWGIPEPVTLVDRSGRRRKALQAV